MKQESSQNPTHCSYDPLSPMRESAPPILSLKRARPSQYLGRLVFLILDLIAKEKIPEGDILHELIYLVDRLEDEGDIQWIYYNQKVFNEARTLFKLLTTKCYSLRQAISQCKFHMEEFDFKIQLGCAYFGKRTISVPECLLQKRSPYNRKRSTYRKKFIGVGYNDHGNMKNLAYDGSPGWKEVSSKHLPEDVMSIGEREFLLTKFKHFRRHPVHRFKIIKEDDQGRLTFEGGLKKILYRRFPLVFEDKLIE